MARETSEVLRSLYDQRDATIRMIRDTHGGRGRINLDLDAKLWRRPLYEQLDRVYRRIFQERRRIGNETQVRSSRWKP